MDDIIADSPAVMIRKYPSVLIGAFALLALVLAVLHTMAYWRMVVPEDPRWDRLALGAEKRCVCGRLSRMAPARACRLCDRLPGGGFFGRAMATLLFQVKAMDGRLLSAWQPCYWRSPCLQVTFGTPGSVNRAHAGFTNRVGDLERGRTHDPRTAIRDTLPTGPIAKICDSVGADTRAGIGANLAVFSVTNAVLLNPSGIPMPPIWSRCVPTTTVHPT